MKPAFEDTLPIEQSKPAFEDTEPIDQSSQSTVSKYWGYADIPRQLSQQGLTQIANATPEAPGLPTSIFPFPMNALVDIGGSKNLNTPGLTGNLPSDLMKGIPKIAAETLAETAPNFVSREAMIGGAIGKGLEALPSSATNFIGDQAARFGKALSGNKVEDIKALFKNPASLVGAKSMSDAKEIYGEAVKGAGEFPPVDAETAFDSATKIAQDALLKANEGTLTPLEALEGRQNLDTVIRATKGTEGKQNINTSRLNKLYELRTQLDGIVKSDPGLDQADQIYAQAKLASKFRHLGPVNQGGTPSQLKNMISMGSMAMAHANPLALGVPVAMSPLIVGGVTSALGLMNKLGVGVALPQIGQAAGAALGLLNKKESE